eukprot:scaffold4323_cov133-Skeletonema_marinoi.AAC.3
MLATTAAARSLLRASRFTTPATTVAVVRSFASIEPYSDYGKSVFTGRVADEYLKKHGSSGDILKDPSWTASHSDTVAKAVLDCEERHHYLMCISSGEKGGCRSIHRPSTVAPTPTATGSNPWPPPESATDKPAKSKT